MKRTRYTLCNLCDAPHAVHYLSVPTGMEDLPTLSIRLCPGCQQALAANADSVAPLFDTIVRALRLLRYFYAALPLPSPAIDNPVDVGATADGGPEA